MTPSDALTRLMEAQGKVKGCGSVASVAGWPGVQISHAHDYAINHPQCPDCRRACLAAIAREVAELCATDLSQQGRWVTKQQWAGALECAKVLRSVAQVRWPSNKNPEARV